MKNLPRANRRFDLEFQSEQQRISDARRALTHLLRHAKEISATSRKRVMASMGLVPDSRMFIRH
jgi:hypothetical protein